MIKSSGCILQQTGNFHFVKNPLPFEIIVGMSKSQPLMPAALWNTRNFNDRPARNGKLPEKRKTRPARTRKLTTKTTHARSTIEVHFVRPINLHFRAKRGQKQKKPVKWVQSGGKNKAERMAGKKFT